MLFVIKTSANIYNFGFWEPGMKFSKSIGNWKRHALIIDQVAKNVYMSPNILEAGVSSFFKQ
jgi:hypothetical protein